MYWNYLTLDENIDSTKMPNAKMQNCQYWAKIVSKIVAKIVAKIVEMEFWYNWSTIEDSKGKIDRLRQIEREKRENREKNSQEDT